MNMQRYRSGHNEAVLKTVCPQGHVGSNPTLCVYRSLCCVCTGFFVYKNLLMNLTEYPQLLIEVFMPIEELKP